MRKMSLSNLVMKSNCPTGNESVVLRDIEEAYYAVVVMAGHISYIANSDRTPIL